jgi:putative transposase
VVLDIFSRYVVGWMIADTIYKQQIVPSTLTLHADRGTSMRSKNS